MIVLLQDLFDTIPTTDIEHLFGLLENHLAKYQCKQHFYLKICNQLLKKLSLTMHTALRGRIQLLLSKLFK